MNGYTKGPWTVVKGSYPGVIHVAGPPQPITIITTALDIDLEGSWEREANAHLIAAAPDLLEALQVAEMVLRERGLRAMGEYKQIEAAIAKATGAA